MIQFGDKVRDRVTGFEGIIIAKTEWFNGCIRYMVQPQDVKDGKMAEAQAFDEEQLDVVTPQAVERRQRQTGGPAPDPQQHPSPKR